MLLSWTVEDVLFFSEFKKENLEGIKCLRFSTQSTSFIEEIIVVKSVRGCALLLL